MSTLNMMPEFTSDNSAVKGTEETVTPVEPTADEVVAEEKETPIEPPQEEKPVETEIKEPVPNVDASQVEEKIRGLQKERDTLLQEVRDLRGEKRSLKQDEIHKIDQRIDQLEGVAPEDVNLIDKVLRSKGYITKQESDQMYYKVVQTQKLNEFLEKYPEYKPDNDRNDINWNALQRELRFYRMPDDPSQVIEVLERAHKNITRPTGDRTLEVKKQQAKIAGVGASGVQRSSSHKTLDPDKRFHLLSGGWSEEEIKKIESNL